MDASSSVFSVRIAATGETFPVPPNKSILRVLVENGYRIPSSCSDGRCGTCKTRYVGGEPDHRDSVLEEDERGRYLTVCVSRARSAELVLDLPAQGAVTNPYLLDRSVAIVDQRICVACLTCVRACTFGAARIDPDSLGVGGILGAAAVDMGACTGCGLCAAACPTGAIAMTRFADDEVAATVGGFFPRQAERQAGLHLVAFACASCKAAAHACAPPPGVSLDVVEMPCTGRVDNLHVMNAFEAGADGVMVTGCEPGRCNYATGNMNAERRIKWVRAWLDSVGLAAARARMVHLPDDGAAPFAEAVDDLAREVESLGPSPVRLRRPPASAEAVPDEAGRTAR